MNRIERLEQRLEQERHKREARCCDGCPTSAPCYDRMRLRLVSESMAVLCAISVWMPPACQASGYYNGPGYPVGMSRSSMHLVWQLAEAELQRLKLVVSSGR
jgi:hypothetical protein